ncbi:hypothetical protein GE21DRAFT_1078914 [Neurospora crassa]|nr:hypothetical protein GE21DRAFT_1078914 [Neurospora crassa]
MPSLEIHSFSFTTVHFALPSLASPFPRLRTLPLCRRSCLDQFRDKTYRKSDQSVVNPQRSKWIQTQKACLGYNGKICVTCQELTVRLLLCNTPHHHNHTNRRQRQNRQRPADRPETNDRYVHTVSMWYIAPHSTPLCWPPISQTERNG